jgi:hypothetical protein
VVTRGFAWRQTSDEVKDHVRRLATHGITRHKGRRA